MPVQPVPYSHALHVGQLGLDCRYCHTTVEKAGCRGDPADSDLHELPHQGAYPEPPARAHSAQLGDGRAGGVDQGPRPPGLRLLQPQRACGSGRRLRELPRPRGRDGGGAPAGAAQHELVPELPPQPGAEPSATVRSHEHDLEAPGDPVAFGQSLIEKNHIAPPTDCSTCHR